MSVNFSMTFIGQNGYPWKALGTKILEMSELIDENGCMAMKWQKTAMECQLFFVNGGT